MICIILTGYGWLITFPVLSEHGLSGFYHAPSNQWIHSEYGTIRITRRTWHKRRFRQLSHFGHLRIAFEDWNVNINKWMHSDLDIRADGSYETVAVEMAQSKWMFSCKGPSYVRGASRRSMCSIKEKIIHDTFRHANEQAYWCLPQYKIGWQYLYCFIWWSTI